MMKMNRVLAVITTILCIALSVTTASAQGNVAISLRNGTADPAQCQPSSLNVFLNRTSGLLKICTASNTWTASGSFTGGTLTSPLLAPNGTSAAPSYSFTNNPTEGMYANTNLGLAQGTGSLLVTGTTAAPTALTATITAGAGVDAGTHSYKVTFITAGGETSAGAVSNTVTTAGGNLQVNLTAIPLGNAYVTSRKIYRSAAGNAVTGPWLLQSTIANNTATTLSDNTPDASLTTTAPSANTAIDTRVTVANDGTTTLTGPLTVASTGITFNGTTQKASAANAVQFANGTNAQSIRVYNTDDGAGNAEYAMLDWQGTANNFTISPVKTGTGTLRSMILNGTTIILQASGTSRLSVGSSTLQPNTTNAYDLGGTSLQYRDVFVARSLQGSATKTLVETSATGFVTIAIPNSGGCAGKAVYTVFAADATNTQLVSGELFFAAAATSTGTVTAATISDQHNLNPVTSGTLTNTMTSTTGTNLLTLLANATSSLTQTTLEVRYRIELQGGVCTVTGL